MGVLIPGDYLLCGAWLFSSLDDFRACRDNLALAPDNPNDMGCDYTENGACERLHRSMP